MLARIAFAIIATILLLPCLGFGIFGYLHSFESPGTYWSLGYLALDLILGGAILAVWFGAFFAFKGPKPGCCVGCGQSLGPVAVGMCPECGRPTGH